tara:strand:+ start:423 stop:611 length:189 start_codon:yes stop_codon:yes gene_type:complete
MKFFLLPIFLFIITCGYPDIDSVPSFKNLKITKEELIDLCKLTNTVNEQVNECLNNLSIQNK